MAEFTHTDFSAGLLPGEDQLTGRKNGANQLQNLHLDNNGAVSLTRGTAMINQTALVSAPHTIYSKYIGLTRYRFVGMANGYVNTDSGVAPEFTTNILTGGDGSRCCFGNAYNFILVCSGTKRYKYNPVLSAAPYNLGVGAKTVAPTATPVAPYDKQCFTAGWTGEEGTFSEPSYVQVVADANTLRGSAFHSGLTLNTMSLSSGVGGDEDIFGIQFYASDNRYLKSVTVEFHMDSTPANYYSRTWDFRTQDPLTVTPRVKQKKPVSGPDQGTQRKGVNQWTTLSCQRFDFARAGNDNTKNWTNVTEVRVFYECTSAITCRWQEMKFAGGYYANLEGTYEYIAVNVANRAQYTAISPAAFSVIAPPVKQCAINVTYEAATTGDAQANETWIYRRGGTMQRFYRVGVISSAAAGTFLDTVDDTTAIRNNVLFDETNLTPQNIANTIYDIVGPWFNRWLYFTQDAIYVSNEGNPDSYSQATGVLTPYGTSGEFLLWARKVGNSVIYAATNRDIYEITGTMAVRPDSTIDCVVRPLGTANPPITHYVASDGEALFYFANNGWRILAGGVSQAINGELDIMYRGVNVNAGNVKSGANDNVSAVCAVSRNKLYVVSDNYAYTKQFFVFDLVKKYWYKLSNVIANTTDAAVLFTEEDGTLLAGFASGPAPVEDRYIKSIDDYFNTSVLAAQPYVGGLNVKYPAGTYTTVPAVFESMYYPLNGRIDDDKRLLNLVLHNYYCEVNSSVEVTAWTHGGTTVGSYTITGPTVGADQLIDLSAVFNANSYCALKIKITATCNFFYFKGFSVFYEPLPVLRSFYRSEPTNFGTLGRKRLMEFPLTIDTGSTAASVKLYVDGTLSNTYSITTVTKKTVNIPITTAIVGTDFYITIQVSSGGFRLYESPPPKFLGGFPDPLLYYNSGDLNFGTNARKRFNTIAIRAQLNGVNATVKVYIDNVLNLTDTLYASVSVYPSVYFIAVNNLAGFWTNTGSQLRIEILSGDGTTAFEFYEIVEKDSIWEVLPATTQRFLIPPTNLGSYARKRFSSFAFVIDTAVGYGTGTASVAIYIDRVLNTTINVTANGRQTYVHYFTTEPEGIEIGAEITCGTYLEFYGLDLKGCITEEIPPGYKQLTLIPTNFGTPAKKRIRVINLSINTRGSNVTYTPTIDGSAQTALTINTATKRTVRYYFTTDVYGIDIGGSLTGSNPFEYYGMLQPELVESLPPDKKFDQAGPWEFIKLAKLTGLRFRLIATGTSLTYTIYMDDASVATATITTAANVDKVYDVPWVAKSINGTVCRVEFSSTTPFHRFSTSIKALLSGGGTEAKWFSEPGQKNLLG